MAASPAARSTLRLLGSGGLAGLVDWLAEWRDDGRRITSLAQSMNRTRLDGLLGYHLRRAQLRAFAVFTRHLKETGLTPALFGVLAMVEARPGIGQGEIAGALGADRSTMVRLVDQLERRGLVRRDAHPGDRRTVLPVLTDDGRAVLERATPLVHASEDEFAGALTPSERERLADYLRRLSPGGA